jgi:hypothetical protein
MNILLWVLQVILAVKLLTAALEHGFRQAKPEMQAARAKLGRPAPALLYLTTLGTFFGALALILPGLLGFPSIVTPLAAMAVVVLLLASIPLHLRSREKPKIFVSLVLAVFAIIVAIGRW